MILVAVTVHVKIVRVRMKKVLCVENYLKIICQRAVKIIVNFLSTSHRSLDLRSQLGGVNFLAIMVDRVLPSTSGSNVTVAVQSCENIRPIEVGHI